MIQWVVISAAKILKFVVLAAVAVTTPPESQEVFGIPGLAPHCDCMIFLIEPKLIIGDDASPVDPIDSATKEVTI